MVWGWEFSSSGSGLKGNWDKFTSSSKLPLLRHYSDLDRSKHPTATYNRTAKRPNIARAVIGPPPLGGVRK